MSQRHRRFKPEPELRSVGHLCRDPGTAGRLLGYAPGEPIVPGTCGYRKIRFTRFGAHVLQ